MEIFLFIKFIILWPQKLKEYSILSIFMQHSIQPTKMSKFHLGTTLFSLLGDSFLAMSFIHKFMAKNPFSTLWSLRSNLFSCIKKILPLLTKLFLSQFYLTFYYIGLCFIINRGNTRQKYRSEAFYSFIFNRANTRYNCQRTFKCFSNYF